jgi:uncharacterized protein (TIGR00297 family)
VRRLLKWTDILVLAASVAIAALAYLRKSLTLAGYAFAIVLALGLYLAGGVQFIVLLLVFFISSTLLSKFKNSIKHVLEAKLSPKNNQRDHIQVLANGGPALIMAMMFVWSGDPAYSMAVSAAFAASNADTWASELGILSKAEPVSFVTGKPVRRGLSGGVTLAGFVASLAGAALIALAASLFAVNKLPAASLAIHFLMITLSGLTGSLIDSLLGDTLQSKYLDHAGEITEKSHSDGKPHKLHRGLAFINNDLVNFASGLLAALLLLAAVRLTGSGI